VEGDVQEIEYQRGHALRLTGLKHRSAVPVHAGRGHCCPRPNGQSLLFSPHGRDNRLSVNFQFNHG
jgi:hypothetical protein